MLDIYVNSVLIYVVDRMCFILGMHGVSLKGMKDLTENELSDYQVVIYSNRSYDTPRVVGNSGG